MRRKSNLEIYLITFITPKEAGQFFAQFFIFPVIFFISMFILNAIINSFIEPFPTIIWNYEIWIVLPFYLFMISYFLVVNLIKGYKKGVKMANTNKWVTPVVIGSLVIVALFYWFQIRPSQIKQKCNSWAGNQSGFDREKNEWNKESYDQYYLSCTREKGL